MVTAAALNIKYIATILFWGSSYLKSDSNEEWYTIFAAEKANSLKTSLTALQPEARF